MAADTQSSSRSEAPSQPPEQFTELIEVPVAKYRTAVAIRNSVRMNGVAVTFRLQSRTDDTAVYAAECPRCHQGVLDVFAKLNNDGSFSEPPACPTLCGGCEDELDAILSAGKQVDLKDEPTDRATLQKYLQALIRR